MTYTAILDLLNQFGLIAWSVAAAACLIAQRYLKSRGWTIVMAGSILVVARQVWEFLPGYKEAAESDVIFNLYMMRFVIGALGSLVIFIGLVLLMVSAMVAQSKISQR